MALEKVMKKSKFTETGKKDNRLVSHGLKYQRSSHSAYDKGANYQA